MFRAWYVPFYYYGVIHGDPHLGNYTVRPDNGVNLLDFGCIRVFKPPFVRGVIDLYHALDTGDEQLAVSAYETWGFKDLSREMIEVLNRWARYVYAPLMDDRKRRIQEHGSSAYGRDVAEDVHRDIRRAGRRQAAAGIRVHGPRGGGLGLGVPAPQGRDQLARSLPRADRRFRREEARRAPEAGAEIGRGENLLAVIAGLRITPPKPSKYF